MQLNVARWLPRSEANGPGVRFVVWAQGCSIRCPGCWNPDTWSRRDRTLIAPENLWQVVRADDGIEGITLTGGEPFEQAAGFAWLAAKARESGLSVVVFSGYDLPDLTGEDQRRLLAATDLLVAGPFIRSLAERVSPLIGSSNQRIHYLSNRYSPESLRGIPRAEIIIGPDGSAVLTGFPGTGMREEF